MTKSCASCSAVQVTTVGMKIACLEKWLTTTSMASEPLEFESGSMKSMKIESHGRGEIKSYWSVL